MSANVGVLRDANGLNKNLELIEELEKSEKNCNELISAKLITLGAINRHESRGGHCRTDYPQTNDKPQHTFLKL